MGLDYVLSSPHTSPSVLYVFLGELDDVSLLRYYSVLLYVISINMLPSFLMLFRPFLMEVLWRWLPIVTPHLKMFEIRMKYRSHNAYHLLSFSRLHEDISCLGKCVCWVLSLWNSFNLSSLIYCHIIKNAHIPFYLLCMKPLTEIGKWWMLCFYVSLTCFFVSFFLTFLDWIKNTVDKNKHYRLY